MPGVFVLSISDESNVLITALVASGKKTGREISPNFVLNFFTVLFGITSEIYPTHQPPSNYSRNQ